MRREEEKKRHKVEYDNAKKIYIRCVELNITQLDNPEQQEKLLVVASSFNNTDMDVEKAKRLFMLGEKLSREERNEKEKNQIQEKVL